MANQNMGLLGQKVGMTQIYKNDALVAVTVVSLEGNTVLRVKSSAGKDGYDAVQLGFGDRKAKHTTKAQAVAFEKINIQPTKYIREVRVDAATAQTYSSGQKLNVADLFTVDQKVDVTGTSKGRGFAGVMKRYNFRGFIRSHGTHEYFRHGGSIGTRLTPGHVMKGKKMPGHMGDVRLTVQNITIEHIDAERNLLFLRGGVPGANKGLLLIRHPAK